MQSRALSNDWKDAVTDSTSTHEIAALLQLYGTALTVHAACAAMQPQVLPLPGQAIIMVRALSLCYITCALAASVTL